MIAYVDSSSLVKRYFVERGSAEVMRLWTEAEEVAVSTLAYAECMAAFWRKAREDAGRLTAARKAQAMFRTDWDSLWHVNVSADLNPLVDRLLARHALRGFDVIHLASALLVRPRVADLVFVSNDAALNKAAAGEGLRVVEPGA